MQTSTPGAADLLRVKREHANMFHLPSRLKRRLRQRRDAISVEVNDLIAAYGVHAHEEARRRNREANSASEARYWAEVEAEIGHTVRGGADPANLERLEAFRRCILDRASNDRARARELASAIEFAHGDFIEDPPFRPTSPASNGDEDNSERTFRAERRAAFVWTEGGRRSRSDRAAADGGRRREMILV